MIIMNGWKDDVIKIGPKAGLFKKLGRCWSRAKNASQGTKSITRMSTEMAICHPGCGGGHRLLLPELHTLCCPTLLYAIFIPRVGRYTVVYTTSYIHMNIMSSVQIRHFLPFSRALYGHWCHFRPLHVLFYNCHFFPRVSWRFHIVIFNFIHFF